MANAWARDRATRFYVGFGLVGLLVVALGFGVTYVMPMARGLFSAPWFVHVHGASALGWILLFIAQASLVRGRRTPLHRSVGPFLFPLALLVWASGIATAVWAAQRDLPELGTEATSSLAGTFTGLSLFLSLVVAAARDQWRYGRIHPVWLFVGPALVIEQSVEFALFDQEPMRSFGRFLFGALT